ncbi:MAG: Na/Pi symporter [Pseudomonadales bacterium]
MYELGYALAGLGLFLAGLLQLAQQLQSLTGPRLRAFLARVAGRSVSAAGSGLMLGALTQSTSAAAFVCIGLLNSGALPFSRALTVSAWSSVGTSVLVFLASVDVLLVGLFAIGATGIAQLLNLNRVAAGQRFIGLAFAVGALLTGLGLIKSGGALLQQSSWTIEFFVFAGEHAPIAFLLGLMVTLIVQSSATVSILAVTLNMAGVLPLAQAVLLVCGASIGSGLSVVLVTSHLEGVPRQLALWQGLVKVIGVLIVLALIGLAGGVLPAEQLLGLDQWPVPTRVALLYLVLQMAGALGAGLIQPRLVTWLEHLAPEPAANSRFAPRFIDYTDAARDLQTALELAEREQHRMIRELPCALDPLRTQELAGAEMLPDAERRAASLGLNARIGEFIGDALRETSPGDRLPAVFALQSRNEALRSLQESLHDFVAALVPAGSSVLASGLTESLHLILTVLVDQVCDGQQEEALLRDLTADRSALMENIRAGLMSLAPESRAEGHDHEAQALLLATGIFERAVWLVRQVAFAGR